MHQMSSNSTMSDNEIEEVSFLPGDISSHKKSVYEPTIFQKCCRTICRQQKVVVITVIVGAVIILTAIIAAFARPSNNSGCSYNQNQPATKSTHDSHTVKPTTAPYISTNGKPFPWHDIRLPKTIIPLTYELFLHPNISQSFFQGSVKIITEVKSSTDFIVFHSKSLNITSYSVHTVDKSSSSVQNDNIASGILFYEQSEQVYIHLSKKLGADEKVQIELKFTGSLEMKLSGFYKAEYKTKSGEKRQIATTHFEPTYARHAFPCFDEPSMKANFTLSIVRDKDHISLHNTLIQNTKKYKQNWIVDQYEETVKMSTYLLAFVVCDYGNVTRKTPDGTLVRVFAPKEQIPQAVFAADSAANILEYYEDYFNIQYPLKKQDLIAIPDFSAGAMENWGLITFRMTALLYDPDVSSSRSKEYVAMVVAHELAHQWFGNLVTMKWWDDLWLNEGFAEFVEYIGSDHVNPKWRMQEQFVYQSIIRALNLDGMSSSHPIKVTVSNPDQIDEIFDAISYSKGSSVLKMLQTFLGEDTFRNGLTNYLKEFSYSNAVSSDLWNALSKVVPKEKQLNVETVMNTWINQMGYPVVTVKRENGYAILTQERFLLDPESVSDDEPKSPYNYKWYVPFQYVTSVDPQTVKTVWLNMSDARVSLPDTTKWLKGNAEAVGFYRVNYDDKMWGFIIQQLKTNHTIFSTQDRALLIDDVFNLARSGYASMKTALDISTYLEKEDEYIPWKTALSNLVYIEDKLYNKEIFTKYKDYILKLIDHLLQKYGFKDEGDYFTKSLRQIILNTAIRLGHVETINKGREFFKQWMENGKSIPPDLKTAVYRAGVEYGGEKEWQFCFQHYLKSTVPSEKRQMLSAMAYTRDTRLLSLYLEYSLDKDKIKEQDAVSVIGAVHRNHAGSVLSWRFVQRNWKKMANRFADGVFMTGRLIKSVTSSFSTDFDYQEVKNFFENEGGLSAERALEQALESILMSTNWIKKHEKEVTKWLSRQMQ